MKYSTMLMLHALLLIVIWVGDYWGYSPAWLQSFSRAFILTLLIFVVANYVYLKRTYNWLFTKEFRESMKSVIHSENLKYIQQLIGMID